MRARLRRLGRADEGATALEFAFVAIPFFALLFGIFELAMIFILSTSLDNAVATASRTIRTGTGTPGSATAFATLICKNLGFVGQSTCEGKILINVETFDTYAEMTSNNPIADRVIKPQSQMLYEAGGPESIVLVQVYYPWPVLSPFLTQAVSQTSTGDMLVTSTMAFRNEPY